MKSSTTVNVTQCLASCFMDLLIADSRKEEGRKKKNENLKRMTEEKATQD
jgi:hypothetical protein